jgi:hypothetical protein
MAFETCKQMMEGGFEGNVSELIAQCPFANSLTGGAMGAILVLGAAFMFLSIIALYVYTSLAWMRIAQKLKYKKAWLAWIPIANIAMMLQLGKFHWAWIFLILVPVLGWIPLFILVIIATWRIFEKRKYPGWLSLSLILPKVGGLIYLIVIGFVAWKKK